MSDSNLLVYVSCGGDQEIRNYSMARETGELSLLGTTRLPAVKELRRHDDSPMAALRTSGAPLASSSDGATLYASLRMPPCRVASYRIDAMTGSVSV